jgi:hypothetical protein
MFKKYSDKNLPLLSDDEKIRNYADRVDVARYFRSEE